MAGSINKVILIGNVGKDPAIRSVSNNTEVASFSLATSDGWKDRATGEKKEKTEWHNVVVYNASLVDIVKRYVKKGTKLYIEGMLQTRKWNDQNSNAEKFITEVVLHFNATMVLLGSNNSSNEIEDESCQQATPSSDPKTRPTFKREVSDNMYDDKIPF